LPRHHVTPPNPPAHLSGPGIFNNTDGFTLLKGISSFGMKKLKQKARNSNNYDPNFSMSDPSELNSQYEKSTNEVPAER